MSQPSLDTLDRWMAEAPKEHPPWRYKVVVYTERSGTYHVGARSKRTGRAFDTRWVRATSQRRAEIAGMKVNREIFGHKAFGAYAVQDPPRPEDPVNDELWRRANVLHVSEAR